MLQLGKESRETIEVQGMWNEDIKMMESGFVVGETKLKTELHNMYDRKASDMYLGCTGAYCDLCTHSKLECVERVVSHDFFTINRELETMIGIFDSLEEDGKIVRRKGDYVERQGQIDRPIPEMKGHYSLCRCCMAFSAHLII